MAARPSERGFTLFEIMIAIAILAVMMTVAASTTNTTVKAKMGYEKLQEQQRKIRVAMGRMVRDISMAYVSGNENRDAAEPRTQFEGEDGGDNDTLTFSSFSHMPLYANANESDQTLIRYYVDSDREDSSKSNIMRWESKRLTYGEETPSQLKGETNILFPGVTKFQLEYWDNRDNEWKRDWTTKRSDGAGSSRPPERVKIVFGYENRKGDEILFTTQVRVHLQETLQSFAN